LKKRRAFALGGSHYINETKEVQGFFIRLVAIFKKSPLFDIGREKTFHLSKNWAKICALC